MHEMSIAEAILQAMHKEVAASPGPSRVVKIGVRIGEWSGVDPESLRFCFEAIIAGTEDAPCDMEIDFRPRRNLCPACGHTFALKDYSVDCPQCGNTETVAAGGSELELAYLEMEDQ